MKKLSKISDLVSPSFLLGQEQNHLKSVYFTGNNNNSNNDNDNDNDNNDNNDNNNDNDNNDKIL